MKKWTIRYYLNESSFRSGISAFTETIQGDRNFAINWAQNKVKNSSFKFYDISEI